jgi:transcriptional regulator
VDANEFGLLVSQDPLQATHLPFTLMRPEAPEAPALAVFRGALAYISPTWYGTGPAVPTWNYDAVHVEGVVELVEDPLVIAGQMKAMAARYEPRPGFHFDALPEDYVKKHFSELVGLSMTVTRWIAKRKQSQNRPPADLPVIAEALRAAPARR